MQCFDKILVLVSHCENVAWRHVFTISMQVLRHLEPAFSHQLSIVGEGAKGGAINPTASFGYMLGLPTLQ